MRTSSELIRDNILNPTQDADQQLQEAIRSGDQAAVDQAIEINREVYEHQYGKDNLGQWKDHVKWSISESGLAQDDAKVATANSELDEFINTDYLQDPMSEPPIPPSGGGAESHWNTTPTKVDLFPDGTVSPNDVNQHGLGNCYFDATIAGMAAQNPEAVKGMITQTGTGDPPTYNVKMFDPSGKPIEVAVNGRTLYDKNGKTTNNADEQGMPTWATILEKAYAKYNQIYGVVSTTNDKGYGGTAAGGWPRDVMKAFTGKTASAGAPDPAAAAQATSDKRPIVAYTWEKTTTTSDGKTIFGGHAYTVISADPEKQTVTVRNPWGISDPNGDPNGYVTMSYEDYKRIFANQDTQDKETPPVSSQTEQNKESSLVNFETATERLKKLNLDTSNSKTNSNNSINMDGFFAGLDRLKKAQ